MLIAQFGHFWESAITSYAAPGASTVKTRSLDRATELLNQPLRVTHLEQILDASGP